MRVALAALLLAACSTPRPFAVDDVSVARRLDTHFSTVFGHGPEMGGLLSPRFGDPALIAPGASFSMRFVEHASASAPVASLSPHGTNESIALTLAATTRTPLGDASLVTYTATPSRALEPACYDLVTQAERVPRAVCIQAPLTLDVSMVHMSDVHIGHFGQKERIVRRLRAMVAEVQKLHPDIVVVTGDLAEEGGHAALEAQAAAELAVLDMPVLVILGNHDYKHFPKIIRPDEPPAGYYNFAHFFHGALVERQDVGGWGFFGFDSGPSLLSLRVITRGIGAEILGLVKQVLTTDAAAGRGTVLFSHAPTRSAISTNPAHTGSNHLGSMKEGAHELEQQMLEAASRGERVVHLAGHTHWSDVFFARRGMSKWERVPFAKLTSSNAFEGAVIVNAPSATRITFDTIEHGKSYGFVELHLRDKDVVVRFHLYDANDHALGNAPVAP